MKFVEKINRELMDVELPGIFVSNCMASLDEMSLKLYIYIKFLAKNRIDFELSDIAKKFGLKVAELEKVLDTLESEELILKTVDGDEILDVKEQEINKIYIPKLEPKVSRAKSAVEQKRIAAATAINESFFQGIMALSWYVDISTLFEKYGFDEDVVFSLFKYCYDKHALHKKYLFAVAEGWYTQHIKDLNDLDIYYQKYEKANKIKRNISKKLGLTRLLTEYEEAYVDKWTMEFGFDMDIIELALQKTTSRTNPSFEYINKIISDWNEKGLRTKEAIESYGAQVKEKNKFIKQNNTNAYINAEQTEYNDLDRFYI